MSKLPRVGDTLELTVTDAQDEQFEQEQLGDVYRGKVLEVYRSGFTVEFAEEKDRENWGEEVEFVEERGCWSEVNTIGMLGWGFKNLSR
jgi:hypothetical protein